MARYEQGCRQFGMEDLIKNGFFREGPCSQDVKEIIKVKTSDGKEVDVPAKPRVFSKYEGGKVQEVVTILKPTNPGKRVLREHSSQPKA